MKEIKKTLLITKEKTSFWRFTPLMSDHTRETVNSYGVNHDDFAGMPGYTAAKRSVFVLDDKGTVRYKWVADNPGQEPDYKQVLDAVEGLKESTFKHL